MENIYYIDSGRVCVLCENEENSNEIKNKLSVYDMEICDRKSCDVYIVCGLPCDCIEKLRENDTRPIIYMTDGYDEMRSVIALTRGADFVLEIDTGAAEIAARINALMRRGRACGKVSSEVKRITSSKIEYKDISVNKYSRSVFVKDQQVHLTRLEYEILCYLMNTKRVCTAEEIYTAVWGCNCFQIRKTVVEHIRRLRKKIEDDPRNPVYIRAVFGEGYVFGERITA